MKLESLKPNPGAKHRKKRLGKGESSGLGKTSGRGHKGQRSRSGGRIRPGFEGGQMPLARRLPKKGFNNAQFTERLAVVNVGELEEKIEGGLVNEQILRELGLVRGSWDGIKILGQGTLTKKLRIEAHRISATAKAQVEAAGGTFVDLLEQAESKKAEEKEARAAKRKNS